MDDHKCHELKVQEIRGAIILCEHSLRMFTNTASLSKGKIYYFMPYLVTIMVKAAVAVFFILLTPKDIQFRSG